MLTLPIGCRFFTSNRSVFRVANQLLDKNHFSASFENGRISVFNNYNNNLLTSNLLKMRRSFRNNNFSVILGQEYNYISNNNTTTVGKDISVGLDALMLPPVPRRYREPGQKPIFYPILARLTITTTIVIS